MNEDQEEALLGRARAAYARNGGNQQPGQHSDVQEVDGTTYVTLRNINTILAVYHYDQKKDSLTGLKEWPAQLEN